MCSSSAEQSSVASVRWNRRPSDNAGGGGPVLLIVEAQRRPLIDGHRQALRLRVPYQVTDVSAGGLGGSAAMMHSVDWLTARYPRGGSPALQPASCSAFGTGWVPEFATPVQTQASA